MARQPDTDSPFRVVRLPWLARLHRAGFRGSRKPAVAPVRLLARGAFYLLRRLSRGPVYGELQVRIGGELRTARFDARNRQFGAIYFDRYANGYEPEVAALIEACVGDAGVFYDVGSNWGYFSVLAAAREGFRGRVHAFEPWPSSFRDLTDIVVQLGLSKQIACHNFALGDSSQTASMTAGSHSGLARISPGGSGVSVAVRALDGLALDGLALEPPSLIKIDTEGHEEQVLRGGQRLLAAHRPMLIFEHRLENDCQWQNAGVLELLQSLGYRLFAPRVASPAAGLELQDIDAASRREHPDSGNVFACHASRLDELARMARHPAHQAA
jgi:FkbM family methyltransferase